MKQIEVRPKTFYSAAFGAIDLDGWMLEFRNRRPGHSTKVEVKLIYKFLLFDPKTGIVAKFAEMPERRGDPKRRSMPSIIKWLKIKYGAEWYEKNKHLIGVVKVDV